MEISPSTPDTLFKPGSFHSSSASLDDCGRAFTDVLRVSSFPTLCLDSMSAQTDFVGSRVYACFDVTFHLNFWQNDRGLLCATAVTRGWNGQRIRRKFSRRTVLPGFELATFHSRVSVVNSNGTVYYFTYIRSVPCQFEEIYNVMSKTSQLQYALFAYWYSNKDAMDCYPT